MFIRLPPMIADAITTAPIEKSIRPSVRFGIIAMITIAGSTDCRRITRTDLDVKSLPPVAMAKNRHTQTGNTSVFSARINRFFVFDGIVITSCNS